MKRAATILGSACVFFTFPGLLWANATIRLEPSALTLAVGEKKIVQVVVDIPAPGGPGDPQGLAAFQFTVSFNPNVVHVGNPNEAFRGAGIAPFAPLGGNPFCTIVRGVSICPDPPWLLTITGRTPAGQTDTIDNVNGRVQVAYGTTGTSLPPTGRGVIALLEVVGQGNGCTPLTLSTVIVADNSEPPRRFATDEQGGQAVVGTVACTPGENRSCYDGPAGTAGVGQCQAGTQGCVADCSGFAACVGQVLPATEGPSGNLTCTNTIDDDCDGLTDSLDFGCFASPAGLDHFQCYKVKDSRGSICRDGALQNEGAVCETEEECGGVEDETAFCVPKPFPKGLAVTLADQFETGLFEVQKPLTLCPPADKNGEGINDLGTHLKGYQIKLTKGQCDPGSPQNAGGGCKKEEECGGTKGVTSLCALQSPHRKRANIRVENQFHPPGSALLVDTVKPDRLLVPTAKGLTQRVDPPDPANHDVDHFKCYQVKISRGATFPKGLRAAVVDQFNQPKVYDVVKPTRLCTPVDKAGEGIKDDTAHLLCYQIKAVKGLCEAGSPVNPGGVCKKEEECGGTKKVTSFCQFQSQHQAVTGLFVNNQFGPEQLDTIKEDELCVPSQKILP